MPAPGSSSTTVAAGLTIVMGSMPFGVPFQTLFLGGGCFFFGVCARSGAALYRKLDSGQDVTVKDLARAIAGPLVMIPVAVVASCLVFFATHAAKMEYDVACGGALLLLGTRGLEGFQWLQDRLTNFLTKFLPGGKPDPSKP